MATGGQQSGSYSYLNIRDIFAASLALCKIAGTEQPNISTDPVWIIEKKACDAIQALQIAGIPTDASLAEIEAVLESLGSAAFMDSSSFATASQGVEAMSAIQPGDNVSLLTNNAGYIVNP